MSFIIIILLLVSKLGLNTVICDWYWNQLLGLVSQWLQKHTLGWRPNHQSGTILDLFLPLTKSIYCDPDLPWTAQCAEIPKEEVDSQLLQHSESCLWQNETISAIFEVADSLIKPVHSQLISLMCWLFTHNHSAHDTPSGQHCRLEIKGPVKTSRHV